MRKSLTSLAWSLGCGTPQLCSVLVASYNGAHLITDALDSVFAQSYRPIELVVVDDGSSDGSVEVIRDWVERNSDPQIHFN